MLDCVQQGVLNLQVWESIAGSRQGQGHQAMFAKHQEGLMVRPTGDLKRPLRWYPRLWSLPHLDQLTDSPTGSTNHLL